MYMMMFNFKKLLLKMFICNNKKVNTQDVKLLVMN